MVMTAINRMIPPSTNIAEAYANAGDAGQELVLNMALFLSNFLSKHLAAVEVESQRDVLLNAHLYMVKVSQVDEREIFKICLEYWIKLVSGLYAEIQSLPIGENGILMGLNLGVPGTQNALSGIPLRKDIYKDILSNLRLVTIEKMVKPEEVCVSRSLPSTRTDFPYVGVGRRKRRGRNRARVHEGDRYHRVVQVHEGAFGVLDPPGRLRYRGHSHRETRKTDGRFGMVLE